MDSARKKLIAKIKALLAKTVENGCTEDEALSALTMARKMMDQYEIDDTDISFGGETVTETEVVKSDHDKVRDYLVTSVGFFCGCQSWKRGTSDTLVYCGLESETLFAHWLLDMLADFVTRESDAFVLITGARRIARGSFIVGCTARIAQRLRELTPAPKVGKGIVVRKNALIEAYMEERGIKIRDPFKLFKGDSKAYAAGAAAGDKAQFNRPVDGREERKQLR